VSALSAQSAGAWVKSLLKENQMMNAERIFTAAKNSQPSAEQIARWEKGVKDGISHHERPKTALTGWNGRELAFDDVNWATGYAEPGYTDPKKAVLFANWNHVSQRVLDLLERAGYACEWEDEWSTCSECGKAVRTSPDSHGWQQSFWMPEDSGELFCVECIDPEEYLESLHNKTRRCATIHDIDPAEHGYVQLKEGFENGFHPGQNDDPKAIYKGLREAGEKRALIFVLDSTGQFDISLSVWAKVEQS
jgi:hypothetical protein